jgi:hypothetical protein
MQARREKRVRWSGLMGEFEIDFLINGIQALACVESESLTPKNTSEISGVRRLEWAGLSLAREEVKG